MNMRSWMSAGALVGICLGGCSSSTGSLSGAGGLEVSELLYRTGTDTLEWLEIRGTGNAAVSLAGISVPCVGFTFPSDAGDLVPGQSVVLTSSASLFAARYPGTPIAGVYSGRLADEGEDLTLLRGSELLFSGKWSSASPWPQAAALAGFSLVLSGDRPERADSWKASGAAGGNPGGAKTTAPDLGVEIAEVRPSDDSGNGFVELVSRASSVVDLSGWILTDSVKSAWSDTLPQGTVLEPGARLVLGQVAATGKASLGKLRPSRVGGKLFLFGRTSAGALSGGVDALEWGALPKGSSFARLEGGGTGVLVAPTPGGADTLQPSPSVYVSEICYHPATGAEYLELTSLSDTTVHLGALDSTLAWSVSGLSLRFAVGDTLAPHGRMVLVSGEDTTAQGFRASRGIAADVPVLTYAGRLDNAGERLELRQPLVPRTLPDGTLVWSSRVVDAAAWEAKAPWPVSADGGGTCLERIDPRLPGDALRAWKTSTPTPGA